MMNQSIESILNRKKSTNSFSIELNVNLNTSICFFTYRHIHVLGHIKLFIPSITKSSRNILSLKKNATCIFNKFLSERKINFKYFIHCVNSLIMFTVIVVVLVVIIKI